MSNSPSPEPIAATAHTLPPAMFGAAFPFHLILDRHLTVVQIGSVLQRICPELAVGQPLAHHFHFVMPAEELTFAAIIEQPQTVYILEAQQRGLQLKGSVLFDSSEELLFFLGSPLIRDPEQLKPLGLSFQDFAIHDPIADFLLLLHAQQTSLTEAKKLNDKLRTQREQLRQVNQALTDRYAEQQQLQDQVTRAQEALVAELSTPLIPISDDIMVMPLIGAIDARRAQQVLEALLEGVNASRAKVVILDITGVAVVDTHVASWLIQAARAVRLLGTEVMLTGIRPHVAQSVVALGIDMRGILTHGTLQSGIQFAMTRS